MHSAGAWSYAGVLPPTKRQTGCRQPEEYTLAPMLSKEMSKIDWNEKTAGEIKNLVRGLNPIMGTYSFLNGKKVKFWIRSFAAFKISQSGRRANNSVIHSVGVRVYVVLSGTV